MAPNPSDVPPLEDRHAELERALIAEYLRALGHDPDAVRARDDAEAHALRTAASTYAAAKLAEMESRAHYLQELHWREG